MNYILTSCLFWLFCFTVGCTWTSDGDPLWRNFCRTWWTFHSDVIPLIIKNTFRKGELFNWYTCFFLGSSVMLMVGSFKLTRIQAIQHISTFFRLGKCNPCNYLVTWKLGVWNFVVFRLVRRWLHICFSFAGFGRANMKPAPPVGFNLTFVCPQGQVFESDWLAMPFVMMTCQVRKKTI